MQKSPVRTGYIRQAPIQIAIIKLRLCEDFNKAVEPRVKFIAAGFITRRDNPGVNVQDVDRLLVSWTS
jgi:hypothetical protein